MSAGLLRAAEAACRVLIRLEATGLPVQPLEILRRCRDTRVCTYMEGASLLGLAEDDFARLCGDADAFTVRASREGRPCYVVCYRAGGNAARLRFTLAHELGHIVLRHEGEDPYAEAEANCFASWLLCPEAACDRVRNLPLRRAIEGLSRMCHVSFAAAEAAIRRKKLPVRRELLTHISMQLTNVSSMEEKTRSDNGRNAAMQGGASRSSFQDNEKKNKKLKKRC